MKRLIIDVLRAAAGAHDDDDESEAAAIKMEQLIRRFEADGFLVLERAISERHVRSLLREQHAIAREAESGGAHISQSTTTPAASSCSFELLKDCSGEELMPRRLHKAQGVGLVSDSVRALVRDDAVAPIALALARRGAVAEELDAFGTKYFPVEPGSSGSVGWHDDNHFFGLTRSHTVSTVVYLRDTSVASSCLRVVPGSHLDEKVGTERASLYVPHPSLFAKYISEEEIQSGVLSRDRHGKRRTPVDVSVPAGSAVVFDANLLHSVHPNHSSAPSERVAFHYIPGDLDAAGFDGVSFARGKFADRYLACGSEQPERKRARK